MDTWKALLLLSIALTACAGRGAQQAPVRASADAIVQPSNRAAARLGPPSPRGLGLRRIDRPIPVASEAPLALY